MKKEKTAKRKCIHNNKMKEADILRKRRVVDSGGHEPSEIEQEAVSLQSL